MIASFDDIQAKLLNAPKKTIAVAMAHESDVLSAVWKAQQAGLADAVLVGDREQILRYGDQLDADFSVFDIIDESSEQRAVVQSVQLVKEQLADTLMKGTCSTATLLRAVLDRDHGLRSGSLLSHLAAFEPPNYHKLIFVSDAAMNIAPDLEAKRAIAENAIRAVHELDLESPKVALIAAVEKVNPTAMPCTAEAAILSQMNARHQLNGATIDGPLALDNAISKKSCDIKGIDSPVGGDADILIMPDIEAANVFYKSMAYLTGAKTAGIIVGAQAPIILTSRADRDEIKFLSIALGMVTSQR